VDAVGFTVHFDEFVLVVRADAWEHSKSIIETRGGKHLARKLSNKRNLVNQPVDTVATCTKVRIPNSFTSVLDGFLVRVREDCLPRMLHLRECSSSKYYPEIPCVVAKSLIVKYQRNPKCVTVSNIVLPICGDQGKQVKLVDGGLRIPALFKKEVLPVVFPSPYVAWFDKWSSSNAKGSGWRLSATTHPLTSWSRWRASLESIEILSVMLQCWQTHGTVKYYTLDSIQRLPSITGDAGEQTSRARVFVVPFVT
jgi:hypothetical protein